MRCLNLEYEILLITLPSYVMLYYIILCFKISEDDYPQIKLHTHSRALPFAPNHYYY